MKLLVGSVFKNTASDQVEWLKLQHQFLSATTKGFDHVSFFNDLVTLNACLAAL